MATISSFFTTRESYLHIIIPYILICILGTLLGAYVVKTYLVIFVPIIILLVALPFINIKGSIYTLVFLIPFEVLVAFKGATLIKFWGVYILLVYLTKNIIKHRKLGFQVSLVHKIALLFLPLTVLSTFFGIDKTSSIHYSITLLQLIVFSIVIYSAVKEEGHTLLAKVFFVACAVVCLLQILKYFGVLNVSFFNIEEKTAERMQGYTGDPNRFGLTLLPAIYFGIGSIMISRNIFWKALASAIILVLILGILLTFSRGIILALIISLLIFVSWQFYKKGPARLSVSVILFLVLLAYLYLNNTNEPHFMASKNYMESRIDDVRSRSSASENARVAMIKIAPIMMLTHPFGVGFGNFDKIDYTSGHSAHNLFLEVGCEFGFLGLACFMTMVFLAIKPLFSKRNSPKVTAEKVIIFGFVAFLIGSLTLDMMRTKVLWFLIGLVAVSGEYIVKKGICNEDRDNVSLLS